MVLLDMEISEDIPSADCGHYRLLVLCLGYPDTRQVFVVHGGLPMDPIVTLADINSIDRRRFYLISAGLLGLQDTSQQYF